MQVREFELAAAADRFGAGGAGGKKKLPQGMR
jgi:hypothetical protein